MNGILWYIMVYHDFISLINTTIITSDCLTITQQLGHHPSTLCTQHFPPPNSRSLYRRRIRIQLVVSTSRTPQLLYPLVWKLCSSPISHRLVSCSASTGLLTAHCTGPADARRYTPDRPLVRSMNKLDDNFLLLLEMQVQNKIQYLFEMVKHCRYQINNSIYQCQQARIYRDSTSFGLGIPAGMLFFFLVLDNTLWPH